MCEKGVFLEEDDDVKTAVDALTHVNNMLCSAVEDEQLDEKDLARLVPLSQAVARFLDLSSAVCDQVLG